MSGQILNIFKKETMSYFEGMQGWIILSVYTIISMFVTFFIGGYFSLNNADMFSYFYFQPYIFAVLVPAITMRLWAEERKSGTIEFLLTQPLSINSIVVGKFLSSWFLCLCMLLMSLPLWVSMNINFETDNANIICGYLGIILTTGSFCALGCLISSFCSAPAVSYLWGVIVLFIINVNDFGLIIEKLHLPLTIQTKLFNMLNLNRHYYDFISGQIGIDNITFFVLLMIISLWLNNISIEYKKN